jgi:hypothetical protein
MFSGSTAVSWTGSVVWVERSFRALVDLGYLSCRASQIRRSGNDTGLRCVLHLELRLIFSFPLSCEWWGLFPHPQANIWIFILSFIGNYVWTHYFYNLLGATYTFEAWRLNDVSVMIFIRSLGSDACVRLSAGPVCALPHHARVLHNVPLVNDSE